MDYLHHLLGWLLVLVLHDDLLVGFVLALVAFDYGTQLPSASSPSSPSSPSLAGAGAYVEFKIAPNIDPPLASLLLKRLELTEPNNPPVAFPKNPELVEKRFLGASMPNKDFGISTLVLLNRILFEGGGGAC